MTIPSLRTRPQAAPVAAHPAPAAARPSRPRRSLATVTTAVVVSLGMLTAACSGSDEVATGPTGGGQTDGTTAGTSSETDPAALAGAIDGIDRPTTTEATVPETTLPPTTLPPVTAPPQTAPPQTAPPQTAPPQTSPPPPQDNRTPPTPASGLSGDEQKIVNHINGVIGKALTPEVSLMNSARAGQNFYSGSVSYSYWVYTNVTGGGGLDALLPAITAQVQSRNFASCTHVGVGWTGNAIHAHCFTY